jgi:hypothetical protein
MAHQIARPRKQRTRQHIIGDIGVHYLEGFILEEGHAAQRLGSDYGYDLIMWTFDERGFVEPGSIYFQCKASESFGEQATDCMFDLDIRDYNLWMREKEPVILILYDASKRQAYWLAIQRYFQDNADRRPRKASKTVRVRVSKKQIVNQGAIASMRGLKSLTHHGEREEDA